MTPEEAREAIGAGTGRGVRIAIIDSGVDADHPRLAGLSLTDNVAIIEDEMRLQVKEGEGHDVYGHGTAVAGIIREVAPEAQIGSFRVLDARSLSRTSAIRVGAMLAIVRGYHILNCSFGCKGLAKYIMPHKEWIDQAYLKGIHVVAACSNFDVFEPEWPGHFTSVIGVNMARSDTDDFYYRPHSLVEYAARGENVNVAWLGGDSRIESGSSFAAPLVTGKLARLLSVEPALPPAHVLDLLPRIAEPWREELRC